MRLNDNHSSGLVIRQVSPYLNLSTGSPALSAEEMRECEREFQSLIIKQMHEKHIVQGLSLDDSFDHLKCKNPLMPEISTDPNGVLKLLSNLKPDKGAGPHVVLKELRHEITHILCLWFERSLSTGVLPSDWTKARVSPLFKTGDKSDPANYSPISLTCILQGYGAYHCVQPCQALQQASISV